MHRAIVSVYLFFLSLSFSLSALFFLCVCAAVAVVRCGWRDVFVCRKEVSGVDKWQ